MRVATLASASLLVIACGGAGGTASVSTNESTQREASEGPIAEVPFRAEQIRDATQAGRTYVFRFEQDGTRRFERWVFERVDARGYGSSSTPVDERGEPIGSTERSDGTWEDLEAHAHFPAARTTITNAQLTIPLGTFGCRLYTVTSEEDDGRTVVARFWFATELPGAPVRMVREVDGETLATMMLVAHEPPIPGR